MKIQQTNHFLNTNQLKSIETLLSKMNGETVSKKNDTWFSSTITKELSCKKDKVRFIDGRMIFDKVPQEKQMQRETLFTIKNTELVINNKTGEIVDWHKPFFTSWGKIMKNVDKYLKFFEEHFNDTNTVKKKKITMEGFTKKGMEILEKLKGKQ